MLSFFFAKRVTVTASDLNQNVYSRCKFHDSFSFPRDSMRLPVHCRLVVYCSSYPHGRHGVSEEWWDLSRLNALYNIKVKSWSYRYSSHVHRRVPERRRVRSAGAVRVRARFRRRAVRARRGRVRGGGAPSGACTLRATRALRQHARLLLLRLPRRVPP
jgi:hypothetical protein